MNKSSSLSYTPIVPIYFLVLGYFSVFVSYKAAVLQSAAYSDIVAVGVIHIFCSGVASINQWLLMAIWTSCNFTCDTTKTVFEFTPLTEFCTVLSTVVQ